MKLNTDGSFCSATDRAGIGGILRNDKGDFIMAFSYSVDCETNNHAEALAAEFGINWCIQQGLNNIILELDSQIIANMLKEKGTDNLKLKHIISRITGLINGNAVQTAHCYREANSVADFFAKLASTSGRRTLHNSHIGLPRVAKGLIQLDKQQLPTFRRRFEKSFLFSSSHASTGTPASAFHLLALFSAFLFSSSSHASTAFLFSSSHASTGTPTSAFHLLALFSGFGPLAYSVLSIFWDTEVYGNPMWRLQQKLKILSKELSKWSRNSIGDVLENVKKFEKEVSDAETAYLNSDSNTDRTLLNKAKAEYIKWLKMEDSILRQKARIKWAEEGDSNTKYFHSTIKARRRRAQIYKIKDQNGQWVEGNLNISKAAIDHFSDLFSGKPRDRDLNFIRGCDNLISTEDNALLTKYPTAEEIKTVTSPDCFSKLRPISLSNFSNKILSKILALRINNILPKIISENQSGFVKDMSEAYDKLDWNFLISVLRKMGDPLSPTLFVIAAETLSRALNHLNQNDRFINFSMHKKGPQINHLSYADDLVLFTSANKFTIKLMMNLLRLYQKASGCPIYCGRKRISYFSDISKKILNKIAGWQGRFLSPGGKATIIKHVLQSQALHIFAALMPPVTSLYEIEMQFANFFWGEKYGKNSYHWSSWENMSYPTIEGGLGFRSLIDICHTFAAKRWWRLRTEPSLWAHFIKSKYCQRSNLNSKTIAPKNSAAWKDLLHIRDKIEANISWKINSGNSLLWWDNWTHHGSLYQILKPSAKPGNVEINHFLLNQQWHIDDNPFSLPMDTLNLIKSIPIGKHDEKDQPIWNLNSNGLFTCSSALEFLRKKYVAPHIYKFIWIKEIPFKVSFFMWKLLKKNLPLDANLARFNIDKGASCCCCRTACIETGNHVFAQSELAKQIWQIMTRPLGISITGSTVQTILWQRWRQKPTNIIHKFLLLITPMIIKVAIRQKFKSIDYTWNWSKVCFEAENFKAVITSKMIRWIKPIGNTWKLNTDGSYMKNQNKAGAGGIVRNRIGNMIVAFAYPTQFYTNNYSEAYAALVGISWCVNHPFESLEVELDSKMVVQMIDGSLKPPWRLLDIIENTKAKMAHINISIKHCFREGNEVADALAKYATQIQVPRIFLNEGDLPTEARGPLRMNKLDFPSFRRRVKKNSEN
ncbi:uncharacterized protein LOC132631356 [Lycium barbarum]|uniref:uncharacterized protein LOC132631356 n=1 Tax=Lycium barbarum TaxID=112863 RepID=UPI00293EB97E|nr:uncharacterized protein LOC132631356 [Lycium barbarum]